jgi:hypothetical protein
MPYLIDGHNLIASIPGIDLEDPDDEIHLIVKLRTVCARTGKEIVVDFDRRAPGSESLSSTGELTVRFVTPLTQRSKITCSALAEKLRIGR